jgi:hypothetical protein
MYYHLSNGYFVLLSAQYVFYFSTKVADTKTHIWIFLRAVLQCIKSYFGKISSDGIISPFPFFPFSFLSHSYCLLLLHIVLFYILPLRCLSLLRILIKWLLSKIFILKKSSDSFFSLFPSIPFSYLSHSYCLPLLLIVLSYFFFSFVP